MGGAYFWALEREASPHRLHGLEDGAAREPVRRAMTVPAAWPESP
jgi:hypothetical protein